MIKELWNNKRMMLSVCVCVVSVIVKCPVLPPYVVDGLSRNYLYYYYYNLHQYIALGKVVK